MNDNMLTLYMPQNLSDQQLREFWMYQSQRIKTMKQFHFCGIFLPVAEELKSKAEQEMDKRGMNWNIKQKT